MSSGDVVLRLSPVGSVIYCFILASIYVILLYVGADYKLGRNHPHTVRQRFIRATLACLFSILAFWSCCKDDDQGHQIHVLLGFTYSGFLNSIVFPMLLTLILFLGPIVQSYYNGSLSDCRDFSYWKNNLSSVTWMRDHFVGPITEEIVYRACMLPVLIPCFGSFWSIFLCPLFFGLAHFHHIYESLKEGKKILLAFCQSGSILPCITAHMFCNYMGFPDINEVLSSSNAVKTRLLMFYVIGFVSWCLLLHTLNK